MIRIRTIGLALVAVFALSAVVASAASAHAFHAVLPAGKTFPQSVAGSGAEQKFKSGFGTVTCKKATSSGEAKATEEKTTKENVNYSECTSTLGKVAEPITAEYELFAENAKKEAEGEVSILKAIVLEFTEANCKITIAAQTGLTGVKYKNNAAKTELTVESATKKIKEKGDKGLCILGGTEGEYTGNVTGKLVNGGELFWL